MSDIYTIKPLNWRKTGEKEFFAETPFGYYRVFYFDEKYHWEYNFEDYYDEDQYECSSLEEGKQKAEKHWRKRLEECLNKVNLGVSISLDTNNKWEIIKIWGNEEYIVWLEKFNEEYKIFIKEDNNQWGHVIDKEKAKQLERVEDIDEVLNSIGK